MKIRSRQGVLWCLGVFAASSLSILSPADGRKGFLSALVVPLRFIQREAVAQEVGNNATPSHAYKISSDLISEIEVLRQSMGVTDFALEAEPQEDRSPIHAYAKSLEVMEQFSGVQQRLGMPRGEVGHIPIRTIQVQDVYSKVRTILAEGRRIKEQLVIEDEIRAAPLEDGKTISDVYLLLSDASYLLDGLVGRPASISDVYRNLTHVHGDLELVADELETAVEHRYPVLETDPDLKKIAQEVLRSTYKMIGLQTRLGVDASGVPQPALVRVTPAELYEAVNILQAEMVRIKAHLGVEAEHEHEEGELQFDLEEEPDLDHAESDLDHEEEELRLPRNKRPRDLLASALLLVRNLDIVARAAHAHQGN